MKRFGLILVGLVNLLGTSLRGEAERPNVLFLAVDDMKDWVNCLGGYEGTVKTPNIDRLAARGTLFTNAHCPSPKCAPSRAAIMTGLMPSTSGLYDNGHWWYANFPEVTTIPVHFQKHGYQVVGAGKIFHHTAGNHPPNQWHDFQKLLFRDDPWFRGVKLNYPWSDHGPYPEGFPFSGVEGLGHENDWGSLGYEEIQYDDSKSATYAVEFLKQEHDEPFFLACGLFRPHLPWYVPKDYFDYYPSDKIVMPKVRKDDLEDVPDAGKAFAKAREKDFESILEAGKYREAVRAYLASITYADAQLGRVLAALDVSGQAGNTVVVLWSDHGWHLGEKGHWHKTTLWEEATRVPLIISAPGYEPARCSRPVSLIDLYPTLDELCGLQPDQAYDGQSLVPLLESPEATLDRIGVTIEYKLGNVALRTDRFRYIRYADGSEEFYDHETDPYEWKNLVNDNDLMEINIIRERLATQEWAESVSKKGEFDFDPDTFTWKEKSTGRVIDGKAPVIRSLR
ncbi:MAG: iduronate-2-sulfatase [Verrucomicrobiales bacterium]|nr:iduronate-2-sulfatase [Verrucomicrobiales bacterium]|tara:strand:- start:11402 stop:12928 length:1527 start_codon:yes stop_codon:yes gene_type:complete